MQNNDILSSCFLRMSLRTSAFAFQMLKVHTGKIKKSGIGTGTDLPTSKFLDKSSHPDKYLFIVDPVQNFQDFVNRPKY